MGLKDSHSISPPADRTEVHVTGDREIRTHPCTGVTREVLNTASTRMCLYCQYPDVFLIPCHLSPCTAITSMPLSRRNSNDASTQSLWGQQAKLYKYLGDIDIRFDASGVGRDQAGCDLERDIARILEEQALVTRRAGEIEKALNSQGQGHLKSAVTSPQSHQPPSAKVGFAAIQEMARLQERALHDGGEPDPGAGGAREENIITFDPAANCLQLKPQVPLKVTSPEGHLTKPEGHQVGGLGKFPLEVPSSPIARSPPAAVARVGLRRVGSQR